MPRIISSTPADLMSLCRPGGLDRHGFAGAIAASEGRVLACETIGAVANLVDGVTNAEVVAAHGADLVINNVHDVLDPRVNGLPEGEDGVLTRLARLTGRAVGVNLEPVPDAVLAEAGTEGGAELWRMRAGRLATARNARLAVEQGAQFLVLTGNPATGVTNEEMVARVAEIRAEVGEGTLLVAGRMHAAGVASQAGSGIVSREVIADLAEAGADVVLLPTPGTVPGVTLEIGHAWVEAAHGVGLLAMNAVGTSQEGADVDTVRRLALMSKQTGADIHHLGDCGYLGMALPENVEAYSLAIRGRRHHCFRVASSRRG